MIRIFKCIAILFMILVTSVEVLGGDLELDEYLDSIDFSGVDGIIRGYGSGFVEDEGFVEVVKRAIRGELDLSPGMVFDSLSKSLFGEVRSLMRLMRDMIIIGVLSAVFKAMSDSLRTKSVSELGFYATYIVIVSVLLSSFMVAVEIMRGFISELCLFIEAVVPIMISLLITSGSPAAAYAFNPVMMFLINGAEILLRDVVAPVIIFVAVLEIVNNISDREILSSLAELIKKGVSIALKTMAGVFAAILSIQRISAPMVNNVAVKTAKAAVKAVPVVGQALTGAVDAVLYWSGTVKNGVMITVVIFILLMCLPVLIKLFAFVIAYKLTASLIQPICDKRIVNALNAAGSLAALMLGACTLAAVMFVFLSMIIISV